MKVSMAYRILSACGYYVQLYSDDVLDFVVEDYLPKYDDALFGGYNVTSIEFADKVATVCCSKYEK